MTRENFLKMKERILEELSCVAENLSSAAQINYNTDSDSNLENLAEEIREDVDSIKECLIQLESMIEILKNFSAMRIQYQIRERG